MTLDEVVALAENASGECGTIDFKSGFDISSKLDWAEIIKDIVALANSGGGCLIFGANDKGKHIGIDVSDYLNIDPADITNKVNAYTGVQFAHFSILPMVKDAGKFAVFAVGEANIPMVFIKNGPHKLEGRNNKPVFVKGSVYFRHGAKSEPGTSEDLRYWLDRKLNNIRDQWLTGIRKVVETSGANEMHVSEAKAVGYANFTNSNDAPSVKALNTEEYWKYTESEVVAFIKEKLGQDFKFSGHDIRCIKLKYEISGSNNPDFVLKPHAKASPQYSMPFVEWVISELKSNTNFLKDSREAFKSNGNSYRF